MLEEVAMGYTTGYLGNSISDGAVAHGTRRSCSPHPGSRCWRHPFSWGPGVWNNPFGWVLRVWLNRDSRGFP